MSEKDRRPPEPPDDGNGQPYLPPRKRPGKERPYTGLCDEAQADGVPCYEVGRQCEECERARGRSKS